MPVREYEDVGLCLLDLGQKHGVDAIELLDYINGYWLNQDMSSIVEKRKQFNRIDKLTDKLIDACEVTDEFYNLDAIIGIKMQNTINLIKLPAAPKGPNKSNARTLVLQLAKMYPGKTKLSRRRWKILGEPGGPFFRFCRDAFNIADPGITDKAIAKYIAKQAKK